LDITRRKVDVVFTRPRRAEAGGFEAGPRPRTEDIYLGACFETTQLLGSNITGL